MPRLDSQSVLPTPPPSRKAKTPRQLTAQSALLLAALLLAGCKHFNPQHHEYVYVASHPVYLHDRVAAVSNRVGQVTNGEALEVLEKGKRFVKVKTPKGEIGWLEIHAVIDDKLYQQFQDLAKQHANDPAVATAELRYDLFLHVLPGRETPHFLLIPGNAKLQLLERGTVEKTAPGAVSTPKPKPTLPKSASHVTSAKPAAPTSSTTAAAPVPAVAPPMEDWWLVRDSQGHTGWLLAGPLDVDVPDEVGAYAEGQRMVGAYPLAKVYDDGAGREHKHEKGKASASKLHPADKDSDQAATPPDAQPVPKEFTEYVTVLTPHGGLPYDFDQIRVFVWSLNHHRYETAFRLHGIQGYLPVRIGKESVAGQSYPTFTFEIANGGNVKVDPDTGVTRPVAPRTLSFRLEGNMVKRTGADQAPIILTHDTTESAKKKTGKRKR